MLKKLTIAVFSVISFSLPSFSQQFSLDSIRFDGLPAVEAAIPVAAPSAAVQPKEWTLIVYASVKDKLGTSQIRHLLDLKKVGTTDRLNIVVESGHTFADAEGNLSTPTLRMLLSKSSSPATLDADTISVEHNVDMGDWRRAASFIKWAKANYPARRYALILFGHGNGFLDDLKKNKGTISDKQTGNYMTIPEFGLLMKEGGKVDALLMLSCLMQTAEVAWEVKDYTDVIVGSEDSLWSFGFDQALLARTLDSDPGISSEKLGDMMAASYVSRVDLFKYPGGHASVIRTARLGEFSAVLDTWVDAALAAGEVAAARKARASVLRFDIAGLTFGGVPPAEAERLSISGDLYDFVRIYTENLPRETPAQLLARRRGLELMDFISNDLLAGFYQTGKTATGADMAASHGLAIHIPPMKVPFGSFQALETHLETKYEDLAFARAGKWKLFMDWLYSMK